MAPFLSTRIALVDEHDVVRAGTECWLAGKTFTVVGSFRDPADYLRSCLDIDVVVTEIQRDGHAPDIACLRAMCEAGAPLVVYSRVKSDEVILNSIDAGAFSYVPKADGRDQLIAALAGARCGEAYIGSQMAAALERSRIHGRLNLSERERQVLVVWLRTESKDEAGRLLHISPATVRTHLQRVRAKYGGIGRHASTKSALLARAIEDGIIGINELAVPYTPMG